MMVAIKDMEMPKYCSKCEFQKVKKHKGYCARTGSELMYGDLFNARPSDCPLVEIGTCKDCTNYVVGALDEEICIRGHELIHENFYCADYEKRGNENV